MIAKSIRRLFLIGLFGLLGLNVSALGPADMDKALSQLDLEASAKILAELRVPAQRGTQPALDRYLFYKNIQDILSGYVFVRSQYEAFVKSGTSRTTAFDNSCGAYSEQASQFQYQPPFDISTNLKKTMADADREVARMRADVSLQSESIRKQALIAKQNAAEEDARANQERIDQETKARNDQAELEQKNRDQVAQQDRDSRLRIATLLEKQIKKLGYKRISRDYGFTRFLAANVLDNKLDENIGVVFWYDISADDRAYDTYWSLAQVVGKMEFYRNADRQVLNTPYDFMIAIPAESSNSIEGQHLKQRLYAYRGSTVVQTVLGATKIVQRFEPVESPTIKTILAENSFSDEN